MNIGDAKAMPRWMLSVPKQCDTHITLSTFRTPPLCSLGGLGIGYERFGGGTDRIHFRQRAPDGQDQLEAAYSGTTNKASRG